MGDSLGIRLFAEELIHHYKGRLRLQPSWVRNREEDNFYNQKTRECLAYFDELAIEHNDGDVIFASGNAITYLSDYLEKKALDMNFKCGDTLYSTKLDDVNEISINCNGDVLACSFSIGNIYEKDIIDIIKEYNPYKNPFSKGLLEKGIRGLVEIAQKEKIPINLEDYYSPCEVCRAIVRKVNR